MTDDGPTKSLTFRVKRLEPLSMYIDTSIVVTGTALPDTNGVLCDLNGPAEFAGYDKETDEVTVRMSAQYATRAEPALPR